MGQPVPNTMRVKAGRCRLTDGWRCLTLLSEAVRNQLHMQQPGLQNRGPASSKHHESQGRTGSFDRRQPGRAKLGGRCWCPGEDLWLGSADIPISPPISISISIYLSIYIYIYTHRNIQTYRHTYTHASNIALSYLLMDSHIILVDIRYYYDLM